jgi:hypothetical protein
MVDTCPACERASEARYYVASSGWFGLASAVPTLRRATADERDCKQPYTAMNGFGRLRLERSPDAVSRQMHLG